MKKLFTLGTLAGLTLSASAATISLTSSDFEGDNSAWSRVDGAGANSTPSTYIEAVAGYGTGNNAHLKADGGNYLAQTITTSDVGAVDATTFSSFTVTLDYGQRQNGSDSNIRIALWNATTDTELAFVTQTITGATETWTEGIYNLSYDNSAQTAGNILEFRITNTDPDLGATAWQNTASVDNISITAVPEPSSTALIGLGGLSLILRRRK